MCAAFLLLLVNCDEDDDTSADTSQEAGDVQEDSCLTDDTEHVEVTDTTDEEEVLDPDPDDDGLTTEEEADLGTDPEDPDTDGDGYWDRWEVIALTDPLDPLDHPEYVWPEGQGYVFRITAVVEPAMIVPLVGSRLNKAPPLLLIFDGLTDGEEDELSVIGGLGVRTDLGLDDLAWTEDDVYGLAYNSVSQINGEFMVALDGSVTAGQLDISSDILLLNLTGIAEITRGISLQLENVQFQATFDEGLIRLEPTMLFGELTVEGLNKLMDDVDIPLPIDPEILLREMDTDNDGIVLVEMELMGMKTTLGDWVSYGESADPLPREPGECCPELAVVGTPIDPFLTVIDQGTQPEEEELIAQAIEVLLEDPDVDIAATMRWEDGESVYYVYNPEGSVAFRRVRDGGVQTFELVPDSLVGINPLENTDPTVNGTYEEEMANSTNPEGTLYSDLGYTEDDERMSFVDEQSYPFGYERLSQLFDDPRCGDLILIKHSYQGGGGGSHGHLGSTQSRSPLIIAGPGIFSAHEEPSGFTLEVLGVSDDESEPLEALFYEDVAKTVDITPTLAAALGVEKTMGVDSSGHFSDQVYLKWQDGNVLWQVFEEPPTPESPTANYAVIIINDGLLSTEIIHQALTDGFDIPNYRRLMSMGVTFRYGAITNFPSVTYPSHNTLGSSAYSGHHGIVGNAFFEREVNAEFNPISDLFETDRYFGSAHKGLPVETFHMTLHRNFGAYDEDSQTGTLTASLNDPSNFGADLAPLERRTPSGFDSPGSTETLTVGDEVYELPPADLEDFEALADNSTVILFHELMLSGTVPLPKYTIMNFSSSDGAGHGNGPHGDQTRLVIERIDKRMGILLAILEEAGILDETMIVLSSDHGMELTDNNRGGSSSDLLRNRGFKFRHIGPFVYFNTLSITVDSDELNIGEFAEIEVTLLNSDDLSPVRNGIIDFSEGAEGEPVLTDEAGMAVIGLTPSASEIILTVTHNDFNEEHIRLIAGE